MAQAGPLRDAVRAQILDRRLRPAQGAGWIGTQLDRSGTGSASASQTSSRPDSVSPIPRISFRTSVACSVPITPVTAPSTPGLAAAWDHAGRRWLRIQAAVARAALMRLEHRKLAVEPQHGGGHQGPLRQRAGIGHQEARGEIVGAVADDVVVAEQVQRVVGAQPRWCVATCTSGLIAVAAAAAETTLGTPIRSVVWATWRCRLDKSTTSSSTRRSCRSPPPPDTASAASPARRRPPPTPAPPSASPGRCRRPPATGCGGSSVGFRLP